QHQRRQDRGERPPLPLAGAGSAACQCAGAEREAVLASVSASERSLFTSPRLRVGRRGEVGSGAAKRNAIRGRGALPHSNSRLLLRKQPLTPTLSPRRAERGIRPTSLHASGSA